MNPLLSCARCNATCIVARDHARKAGALSGQRAVLLAARRRHWAVPKIGMVAGPVGLAGSIFGALVGGAAGCAAGSAVGVRRKLEKLCRLATA